MILTKALICSSVPISKDHLVRGRTNTLGQARTHLAYVHPSRRTWVFSMQPAVHCVEGHPAVLSAIRPSIGKAAALHKGKHGKCNWLVKTRYPQWLALVNGHMDPNLRSNSWWFFLTTQMTMGNFSHWDFLELPSMSESQGKRIWFFERTMDMGIMNSFSHWLSGWPKKKSKLYIYH